MLRTTNDDGQPEIQNLQQRIDEAIENREEYTSTIFKYAPAAIIIIDSKGMIFKWNPKAEAIFGWASEEVIGRYIHEVIIPVRFHESHLNGMKHYEETGEGPVLNKTIELSALRKNNEEFSVSLGISPTTIKGQRFFIGFINDITERKTAEEQTNKNIDQINYQNTQLLEFCNIVSHDLRGPLVNILGLIHLIEHSAELNEKVLFIDKLKPVVNHLNETFNELVEIVHIKNDLNVKSEKIRLKDALKKIMDEFKFEIAELEVDIKMNIIHTPFIFYPPKYLTSILYNLISNSFRYRSTKRKLNIYIETKKVGQNIILSICDNGLGINLEKNKDELFKMRKVFHRHPDAKGFGLYLTKVQVEVMGGKIWAESRPDEGSTFFIEFKNQNNI